MRSKGLTRCLLFLGMILGACFCTTAYAAGVSREHHPWGCFAPGSWKRVRIVCETLDHTMQVTNVSVTELKTILEKADDAGVTLRIESTVEVAGKKFIVAPQLVKQGYGGETGDQPAKFTTLNPGRIAVEDQQIPCEIYELQQTAADGSGGKTVMKTYYTDKIAPYVLRRETTASDGDAKDSKTQTTLAVTALNMPYMVLGQIMNTAQIKVVQKDTKGTTVTLAVQTPEVPGGVVAHVCKDLDRAGRVIRRSTLELVDYQIETTPERRTGILGRKRPLRLRGLAPRPPLPPIPSFP
ncbi:MAG: hypothetical protein ACYC35_05445 [Pirellulales bacterium]